MTKGTVLVASPSAIGSRPDASGSSVPACPARLACTRRFTVLTACVEVIPTGLSSTIQPWMSRRSRLRCPVGRAMAPALLMVVPPAQIAFDWGRFQKIVDAFGFLETFVDPEPDLGSKLEIDSPRYFAPQEPLVALERVEHRVLVASAERHDIDRGEPQVCGHTHLGDGDDMALDHRIMHVAASEQLGKRMAYELAHPQLALRRQAAAAGIALAAGHGRPRSRSSSANHASGAGGADGG